MLIGEAKSTHGTPIGMSRLATVTLGAHIMVQGEFVRMHEDGRVTVRDGGRVYTGRAICREETHS